MSIDTNSNMHIICKFFIMIKVNIYITSLMKYFLAFNIYT